MFFLKKLKLFNDFSDVLIYSYSSELVVAFGFVLATFCIFLILYVAFSHKKILAFLFLCLSLASITIGPFFVYNFVALKFEKTEYLNLEFKQLYFQNAAVLKGELLNASFKKLADCKIEGKAFEATNSKLKQILGLWHPRSIANTVIEGIIYPDKIYEFRLDFKNINFDDNTSVFLKTRCR